MNDVGTPTARTVMVAEVVADAAGDMSNNGGSTVSAGTPSFSAGTPNASIEHASRTRNEKKRKNANAFNQVVSKRARNKSYGDEDESTACMEYFLIIFRAI